MLFSLEHNTFFEWTNKAKYLSSTFQLELGNHLIPILHKLEQVSSDKHIGTMAENLMEALKTNPVVAAKVRHDTCISMPGEHAVTVPPENEIFFKVSMSSY